MCVMMSEGSECSTMTCRGRRRQQSSTKVPPKVRKGCSQGGGVVWAVWPVWDSLSSLLET